MSTSDPKTDLNLLFNQVKGPDAQVAHKALIRLLKVSGLKEMRPLIRIMASTPDEKIRQDIESWLASIKSKEAPQVLAESLLDPELSTIRIPLVRVCWESQLDFTPHLMLFIHLLMTGDYGLAVEAFSVIENTCLERPVSPDRIEEMSVQLKSSLPDQTDAKQRLIREMIVILETYGSES